MNKVSSVKQEIVHELHKPARRNFRRRRVIIKGLNDLWQADLVEMLPYKKINRGYKYILVVINAFSKFVWAEPVKSKNAIDITNAMEKILLEVSESPKNLQTDMGKEFYNKKFLELTSRFNINHYSSYSNLKASIVERVNRTLKSMMWRQFSLQGNYKWLTILPNIVSRYNNTKHRTTGFKPKDVTEKQEKQILASAYSHLKIVDLIQKFKLGDFVRISKHRSAFTKGYTPNWSNEIFKIKKIMLTNPTTYILEDENKEEISGAFYEKELLKVKYPDIYLVEKVIRRKGTKAFVKWLGLDKSHNSWIDKKEIV